MIAELLRPRDWKPPEDRAFFLRAKEIDDLCNMAEACLQQEPTVLKLHAPIKIFGGARRRHVLRGEDTLGTRRATRGS